MTTPANPDDLITWLRAQLDDDEQAAKAWLPLGNPTAADRDHIARHDPARVLAEVDAKRRILGAAEGAFVYAEEDRSSEAKWADESTYRWILAVLALPYADRPGYREEWKP